MDRENQQLTLRTGRRLGYAEYGEPGGLPLFYFHGWPSSRLEARGLDRTARALGIRIISPERPGYGLSEFLPARRIPDWTSDLVELASHLDFDRFSVLGLSGGGPYAAACAALIPGRLESVLMVGSVGPADAPGALEGMVALNRWLLTFARTAPWLAQKTASWCLKALWHKGEQVIPRQVEERLPPADKAILQNPELRASLIEASKEALREGVVGAAWDGFLLGQPWGFRLQDIRIPVHLWHGERDNVVPPAMGHYLAKTIPECHATFYAEDGHFSLPYGRVEEILQRARVE